MSSKNNKETNGFAVAGFVCSFLIPLLGIIFSAIALHQIKKTNEKGHGLAISGLWIGIALSALLLIFAIIYFVALSFVEYR